MQERERSTYSYTYNRKSNSPIRTKDLKEDFVDKGENEGEDDSKEGLFECNICLDMASNPVVTLCGHLYCWPCLNQWLKSKLPTSNACPVCKSGVKKESVIPIYVRGRDNKDPRKEPEEARPSGQHNEVPPLNNRRFGLFPGTWDNNGGGFSLNVGFFPFFPMAGIHIGGGNMGQLNSTEEVQAFMSRVLLMFATLILVTIILY